MSKFIRYIGSKEPIMNFLLSTFEKYSPEFTSFGDMFAGTCVVSNQVIKLPNVKKVKAFDMSQYSKALSSFVNPDTSDKFIEYIKELNALPLIEGDIFSEFSMGGKPKTISEELFKGQEIKSRLFFSESTGKKIDTIKSQIIQDLNSGKITHKWFLQVTALLLKFADSNAHTTSVYGAYLKNDKEKSKPFLSEELIKDLKGLNHYEEKEFYFGRSMILDSIKSLDHLDILYMDPPYTTRRYENNYHVLDFIADPNFTYRDIKLGTKAGTPDLSKISNPFAKKGETFDIFREMIRLGSTKCDTLFISYSNQGLMTQSDIEKIVNELGLTLYTETQRHKKYKSHTNEVSGDLWEIIWVIKK